MLRAMAAKVVVPYSEAHAAAHSEFALRMYRQRRRCDPKYQRWKYRGPERGVLDSLLLAVRDGKVLGQLGVLPVRVRHGDRACPAQWMCDLMTDPAHRLTGIGPMLVAAATDRGRLTLGSQPTLEAKALITKFGFREITGGREMLLPLRAGHILGLRTPEPLRRLIPVAAFLAQPLVAWRARKLRRGPRGDHVKRCRWQELLDWHPQHERRLASACVLHDESFLRWRCSGFPAFAAELSALKSREGGGLIYGEARPYLRIYDWAAAHEADCRGLFAEACRVAFEWKLSTLAVMANSSQEQQWLRALGFLAVRTPVDVYVYPPDMIPTSCEHFRYCYYDADADL